MNKLVNLFSSKLKMAITIMWWLSWMTENWYFTYKVDTKLRLTNAAWGQGHLMESSGKTAPVTHWLSGCSQPWNHYRTERQGSETGSFHSGGVGYRHLQNILTMCGEKFNNLATWNLIQNAEGVLHQNKMVFWKHDYLCGKGSWCHRWRAQTTSY